MQRLLIREEICQDKFLSFLAPREVYGAACSTDFAIDLLTRHTDRSPFFLSRARTPRKERGTLCGVRAHREFGIARFINRGRALEAKVQRGVR